MSEELTGNDIIDFRTLDEAAQFLFWFGRAGNREQIDERVIKGIQKKGNEGYRKEVARAAVNFLEDRVNSALETLGGQRQMYTYDDMMTALVIFYLQDRREALRDMDPGLLADIRQRADAFLEEYT